MNNTSNLDSIRKNVTLIIMVVLIFFISGTGYFIWFDHEIHHSGETLNRYHLTTISYISNIRGEVDLVKRNLKKIYPIEIDPHQKSKTKYNFKKNVYTIQENLSFINNIQDEFKDDDFTFILKKLQNDSHALQTIAGNHDENMGFYLGLESSLDPFLASLDQLHRLHVNKYKIRSSAMLSQKSATVNVFIVYAFLLAIGAWVISQILRAVDQAIVQQKATEEKLRSYSDELTRSNQELQDFASIASHDLQEPLRKIITFSDRLTKKTKNLDEVSCSYIERMQKSTMRMQVLLDDLLSYSRVSIRPKPFEQVDLNSIIDGTLSDLEHRIDYTKGTINVGDLPSVQADPSQIGQLFLNLIGNALKYHQEGVAPVVNIQNQHSKNGKIRIVVEDNGIGFDERYVDRIFKPFQRLHGRNEYEGTGIGLAICKKVVERHNGRLEVKSKPDEGSTFIITLPEKQP